MTSRDRLSAVLKHMIPDHVPVMPDTSNMIPVRLTGKPYWDIYLYQDPPLWKAYIDCIKHFGIDSLMDGYATILFDDLDYDCLKFEEAIVGREEDKIFTQRYYWENGKIHWHNKIRVYFRDNPPSEEINPGFMKLPEIPEKYEPVEKKHEWPIGGELLKMVKREMGDNGLVGVFCGTTKVVYDVDEIYDYYDFPEKYHKKRDSLLEYYLKRFDRLMSLEDKPDFICTGASGTLIHQTPAIFRELGLPIVKEITSLCKKHNIPSHVHSCGPEKELVKSLVEETDLTIVDPLEIPPMGDCDLKELKKLYGEKIVLKGNLHTTDVMLRGSVNDVVEASKKAIDDAAEGGMFILSTGDQCGRDTPDENIHAMIETAKTYGKY